MKERERKLETLSPQEVVDRVYEEFWRTGRPVIEFIGARIILGFDDNPDSYFPGSMIGDGVVVELEDGRRFGFLRGSVDKRPELTPFSGETRVLIYGFLNEREDSEDKGAFRGVLELAWLVHENGLGEVGGELFLNGAGVPRDYAARLEETVQESPVGLGKWGKPIYPSSSEQVLERVPARVAYSPRVVPYLVGQIKRILGIHQPSEASGSSKPS